MFTLKDGQPRVRPDVNRRIDAFNLNYIGFSCNAGPKTRGFDRCSVSLNAVSGDLLVADGPRVTQLRALKLQLTLRLVLQKMFVLAFLLNDDWLSRRRYFTILKVWLMSSCAAMCMIAKYSLYNPHKVESTNRLTQHS